MPYKGDVCRVSLHWSWLGTGPWAPELMVNSWWMDRTQGEAGQGTWQEFVQEAANKTVEKLGTHWSKFAVLFDSKVQIDGVKVARLDSSGHTVSEGAATVPANTLKGQGSGGNLPPETAVILGLWGYPPGTFTSHKGRKRGRLYLGGINQASMDSNGLLRQETITQVLPGFRDLFNDLQGMSSGGVALPNPDPGHWNMGIASSVDASFTQLQAISLEDQYGSQRRRQNARDPIRTMASIDTSD